MQQVFEILRVFGLKLNPKKGGWAVSSRKFLGQMVHKDGININLEQKRVILNMPAPTSIKEIKIFGGKIVALHHFISKPSDKIKPFIVMLKGIRMFEWTSECEKAFRKIKVYLHHLRCQF